MTEPCTHEEQIQNQSAKIAELEAHINYKDKRIDELIKDQKKMEDKIDKIADNVNTIMLKSIEGDTDIDKRVTQLETKIETQDEMLKQYEEKAKNDRVEERAKTNQYLTIITVGIAGLTFILTHVFK